MAIHAADTMRRGVAAAATMALCALAPSCGDGTGPPAPETITKLAGDNQAAIVRSAVATPPSVLVSNASGHPVLGVTVTFAASSGGGSVTGHGSASGATTSVTTDASGIATVGSWTLGATLGTNTVTATVAALNPVTFTAAGTAGPATSVTKIAGDGLTGSVGAAVAAGSRPTVLVSDAYGNHVSGGLATVFTVGSGGGTVTGATATTDTNGMATVGGWILGTAAGPNTLTATASGLSPVTFTATGRAGSAASIAKQAGDGQTGSVGVAVATAPAVSVKDLYGNPVRAVAVTFTVASGGGSVSGGATSTDSTGSATVGGWTLGPTVGTNTLAAVVQGLPAMSFTATAIDPCATATAYPIGSSVTGALASGDCRLQPGVGPYSDLYSMNAPTALSVRFDMSSIAFFTHLFLFDGNGSPVANGDGCSEYGCDLNSSIRILLGPGDYIARASLNLGIGGPYTLSSVVVPEDVAGCDETVFITRGVTTSQRIESTDCGDTFLSPSYFSDHFAIQLTGGQTYTFSMSSTDFDTYLELLGLDEFVGFGVVASNDDFGGTSNSQITFTATESGIYLINAATYLGKATGAYTLVIQ
jgi:hypothetical protein